MPRQRNWKLSSALLAALAALSLLVIPATAHNWWGNYHWARTSNPFTLVVAANVGPDWSGPLAKATDNYRIDLGNGTFGTRSDNQDWSDSSILDMKLVSGKIAAKDRKKCPPTSGRVEVCSASLGGSYLGVAQLWTNGDHITQATVKVNDSFYSKAPYNTPEERQSVLCEELGHTIGVDHASDASAGCVIGYAANPPPLYPSGHDYTLIEERYAHPDTTTTVRTSTAVAAREETDIDPRKWGNVLARDERGRPSVYGKDLAPGQQVITFVVYPDEAENATVDDGGRNDGGKRDRGNR